MALTILLSLCSFVVAMSVDTLSTKCEPPASCASPSSLMQKHIGTHQQINTLEEDQMTGSQLQHGISMNLVAKAVMNHAMQKKKHTNENVCSTDNAQDDDYCESFLDGDMGSTGKWNYCLEPTATVCDQKKDPNCILSQAIDNHHWMLSNCPKTCCEWEQENGPCFTDNAQDDDYCESFLDGDMGSTGKWNYCLEPTAAVCDQTKDPKCILSQAIDNHHWMLSNCPKTCCEWEQENGPVCSTDNAQDDDYCESFLDGDMGSTGKWNYCLEPTATVCDQKNDPNCILSQAIDNHHWMLSNCPKTCCEWEKGGSPASPPPSQTTESPTPTPTESKEPCNDDPAWKDPLFPGFDCAAWKVYPCDKAQTWGYTAKQKKDLLKSCPKACGTCP